jgi:hypothetical protein
MHGQPRAFWTLDRLGPEGGDHIVNVHVKAVRRRGRCVVGGLWAGGLWAGGLWAGGLWTGELGAGGLGADGPGAGEHGSLGGGLDGGAQSGLRSMHSRHQGHRYGAGA